MCQYWAVATAIAADHPSDVGTDPAPWLADADVVVVVDSLAPWSPDIHQPDPACRVIQLGPDPLYSRFPVRNFRVDVPIVTEVGPGLAGLAAALAATTAHPVSTSGGSASTSTGRRGTPGSPSSTTAIPRRR